MKVSIIPYLIPGTHVLSLHVCVIPPGDPHDGSIWILLTTRDSHTWYCLLSELEFDSKLVSVIPSSEQIPFTSLFRVAFSYK